MFSSIRFQLLKSLIFVFFYNLEFVEFFSFTTALTIIFSYDFQNFYLSFVQTLNFAFKISIANFFFHALEKKKKKQISEFETQDWGEERVEEGVLKRKIKFGIDPGAEGYKADEGGEFDSWLSGLQDLVHGIGDAVEGGGAMVFSLSTRVLEQR